MKAEIEIECKTPDTVIKSLEPDIDSNPKFDVELKSKEDKIKLKIKSKDITGLLAGVNSYLKLIRTSIEVQEAD